MGSPHLQNRNCTMGCVTSRTEIQLGSVRPWEYSENGTVKSLSLSELSDLRKVLIDSRRSDLGILETKAEWRSESVGCVEEVL